MERKKNCLFDSSLFWATYCLSFFYLSSFSFICLSLWIAFGICTGNVLPVLSGTYPDFHCAINESLFLHSSLAQLASPKPGAGGPSVCPWMSSVPCNVTAAYIRSLCVSDWDWQAEGFLETETTKCSFIFSLPGACWVDEWMSELIEEWMNEEI